MCGSVIAHYFNFYKSKPSITRAERRRLIKAGYFKIEQKRDAPKNNSKPSFNRAKEISKFSDFAYRKENTPRGAKSFATMFQKNGSLTHGILAHNEEYAIAKWANQKGYKNLDKNPKMILEKLLVNTLKDIIRNYQE